MTAYSVSNSEGNFHPRLSRELETIFNAILTDNKYKINAINDIKTISGWYKEGRKHPDSIPSRMINDSVERLIEQAEPYLANYMIDKIKAKVRPDLDGLEVIEINPPPIKPYVEYIKKINRVESDGIRITFNVVLGVKLEDIRFRNVENRQTEVHIAKFTGYVTMSIIEVSLSILKVPTLSFRGEMVLCNKKLFEVENISFRL